MMSKLFGVGVEATFDEPFSFTDEWVNAIYCSLEKNMVVRSVDMFLDEDEAKVTFLLGIETFLDDSPESAGDLARKALDRAFEATGDEGHANDMTVTRSEVLQSV
jgi:hypothetical protein